MQESKLLNFRNEPCVIISASGMAEAGRVKHHISNNIENSRNTILMTGYCEPDSLGGRLLSGRKEVHIYGVLHEVHAEAGAILQHERPWRLWRSEPVSGLSGAARDASVCSWYMVSMMVASSSSGCGWLKKGAFTDVEIPELHYEIRSYLVTPTRLSGWRGPVIRLLDIISELLAKNRLTGRFFNSIILGSL